MCIKRCRAAQAPVTEKRWTAASKKPSAKVLEGATARIPKDLKAELPYLLWVYSMGIVLFWIHDSSPKHRRTYRLIDHTVDLLDKLIHLASNPFMRPVRKQALRLVEEIREALPDGDEPEQQNGT